MHTSKRSAIWATAAITLAVGTLLASTTTSDAAGNAAAKGDNIGVPKFEDQPSASGVVSKNAITIPSFTSKFTDPSNGKTYHYTMVGTDPSKGDVSTTIPTLIVPMNFNFRATGTSLNGSDKVAQTVNSPVFQNADIGAAADAPGSASAPPQPPDTPPGVAPDPRVINEPHDTTQLGDAIYRAQFGKSGSGWHVRLGQPDVAPAVTIDVPKNQGFTVVGSRSGATIGLMSYSWFSSKLKNLITTMKISPRVLPVFLVNNTFLYIGTTDNCCVLGYHGAASSLNGNGRQVVNTYMFASYSLQGIFGANAGDTESYIADIHGLSHEVQEWYDDPFVNNRVNPWLTPTAPQYGCTTDLETGDPVVGYGFKVPLNGTVYHPEDEVHYSWFAREDPSRAEQGYYTYLNNFAGVAQGC
ncbi:MAG TPA: hypothetical protein VHR35_09200 [Nocardioides sp.]|jgi:hypothetical protein|nr:hypothetical protein [Nocardioides sp.]